MELGSLNPLIDLGASRYKRPKASKSKKISYKMNAESIYCNGCKSSTPNAKDAIYNYNTNTSKWTANSVCAKCFTNKSVFVKNSDI